MPGEDRQGQQPALRSGRFLRLAKLGPTCLLCKRNSPSSCSRENTLGSTLPTSVRRTLPSRKFFQNRNRFREFICLLLRVPVILAEPSQRLTYICHFNNPPQVTCSEHCSDKCRLTPHLKAKKCSYSILDRKGRLRVSAQVSACGRYSWGAEARKRREYLYSEGVTCSTRPYS